MAEKILIVDDDVDSLKLIGLMLQRNGYEVVAANAGSQALQKALQEIPDLIILDVMMPDMNGYEVCRRLRGNPRTQGIPIIMFTAKTLIDDKVAGFEAGADDYLTKPTHPQELASRVKAILARSATEKPKPVSRPQGATIGVIGAKGGVGTTTIALNIAAALLQTRHNPIVADFRPGSGGLGLLLGVNRAQGMASILRNPPNEISTKALEGALVTHQSGLRALLSSTRPKEALLNFPMEAPLAIVNGLRTLGRPVIFDMGSGYSPLVGRLHREMDRLILVVEPGTIALAIARDMIQEFGPESGNRINIVVVNRSQSSVQTPWHEVEQILGKELKGIVSAAPELAFQATEAGIPIVLYQPNSIVATQIMKISEEYKLPPGGEMTA